MTPPDNIQPRFEPIREHHIRTLLPIEQEAYPDPWTFGMFYQEVESRIAQFFVMYVDDAIVGYGGFWFVIDEAHITKVTIEKRSRDKGHGRRLMQFLIAWAKILGAANIRLEVRESNIKARTLYEHLGFQQQGIREKYYATTGENALVMMKDIE